MPSRIPKSAAIQTWRKPFNAGLTIFHRVVATGRRLYRFYEDNGLRNTVVRIADRVLASGGVDDLLAGRIQGLASHWVWTRSSEVPTAVLEVLPGQAVVQPVQLPFRAILETAIEVDPRSDFDRACLAILAGPRTLHEEPIEPRRARSGLHRMKFRQPAQVEPGAGIRIRVSHEGRTGAVRLRLSGSSHDPSLGLPRLVAQQTGAIAPGDTQQADRPIALIMAGWAYPGVHEYRAGGRASHSRSSRRLRILTYRWHVPHQYELYKLGHDFALVQDLPTRLTRTWDFRLRPLPGNARFLRRRDIDERDFDLAIVHFDENVLSPENTNGALGPEWGAAFRIFIEQIGLPKVAICHGTPQFHGQYNPRYARPDLLQIIEPARRKLVEYLGDTLVICNSHQAAAEWGFARSRVIWHGFDPSEFPPATYERGILSPLGELVTSRPHYRGYFLYQKVLARFPPEFAPSTLRVPDPSPLYGGNQFAQAKFRNYVDEIRRFSVYFNPTLRSPMPRARGEPMMCGVVTVSAKNHDVDLFIKNGVNGFYSEHAEELRDQLLFLCRNPDAARRIGAESRRTALELFHIDRYLAEWRTVLQEFA